ncbi:MAG: arginine deiminase family protein, partial [Myxococcota bacterium]|nr:arginine deiminase family protein [Myxococcota bacterium]
RRAHTEELGTHWSPCGVSSEVADLRRVLLSRPPRSLDAVTDPERWHMLARPDRAALDAAAERLAGAFAQLGVEVAWMHAPDAPPNLLFARDLFVMTPEGAVLARMGAEVRAGEERHCAAALAGLGIPIVATPRGRETLEGADALFFGGGVLIGVGLRTNIRGAARLQGVLRDQGIDSETVAMPARGVQHLLGVVTPVDRTRVLLREARTTDAIRGALRNRGLTCIPVPEAPELTRGRGANLVAIRPGEVIMPVAPALQARLEGLGVRCHPVDVGPYLAAAGGIACATGILERAPSGP